MLLSGEGLSVFSQGPGTLQAQALRLPGRMCSGRPAAQVPEQQQALLCSLGSPKLVLAQRGASERGAVQLTITPRNCSPTWLGSIRDTSRPHLLPGKLEDTAVVFPVLTRVWLCGCGGKGSGQTHLCRKERVAQFCWARSGWPITLLWMASSSQLFPPRPVLSWILGATQSPYLPLRVRDFEEPLFPWSLTYMITDSPH